MAVDPTQVPVPAPTPVPTPKFAWFTSTFTHTAAQLVGFVAGIAAVFTGALLNNPQLVNFGELLIGGSALIAWTPK